MTLPTVLALVSAIGTAQAMAEPVQTEPAQVAIDRLILQSRQAGLPAFERTSVVTTFGKPTVIRVERFDPKAARGHRWTLISIDGRTPTRAQAKDSARQPDDERVPGFHHVHTMLAATRPDCRSIGSQVTCHWASLPANAEKSNGPDLSARLSADVVLEPSGNQLKLQSVRVYAARPFAILAVAKLHELNVVSTYAPGPDGIPALTSQTIDVHVSAPLGMGARSRTISHYRPLLQR